MKVFVEIDLDVADSFITQWAESNTNTYNDGVYGVDDFGVYHMYHHVRTNLVEWIIKKD